MNTTGKLFLGIAVGMSLIACQDNGNIARDEFTGNEVVYPLQQASDFNVSGTVSFKEKMDGSAWIIVALSGTEGNIAHPVHLHLGNIGTPDADVAALLNPVSGMTGLSETKLTQLSDESAISYKQLIDLNACVKVHLDASGPDRDIILAGGNIGSASAAEISTGRSGFGLCKSE